MVGHGSGPGSVCAAVHRGGETRGADSEPVVHRPRMTTDTEVAPGPVARARAVLRPVRGELLGLAVFLAGALLTTGVFVAQALGRPAPGPGGTAAGAHDHLGAGEVGAVIDAHGETDGQAAGVEAPAGGALDELGRGSDGGGYADDAQDAGAPRAGPESPADVVVHVSGAVATPGIVVVPAGARLADAVAAAGGLLDDALPERVNLARPVVDGEQVHVPRDGDDDLPPIGGGQPSRTEPGGAAGGPGGAAGGPADGPTGAAGVGLVDLNRASAAELETLPGIGPAKAAAIVRHRDEHGPFAAPGDLRDVTGIGEATFQGLAELVTVG